MPANWQEKHDRQLFQRETRSKSRHLVRQPAHLEHYLLAKAAHRTAKKRRRTDEAGAGWRLRETVDDDVEGADDDSALVAALTDNGTYARLLGFPEPLPEYVAHLDELEVQHRLNASLPVSLWFYIFQPLVKLARTIVDSL